MTWLADGAAELSISRSFRPRRRSGHAQRLRAYPLAVAFERRLDPAFIRFGMVGAAGFAVDATVLHLMVDLAGLNFYRAVLRFRRRRHRDLLLNRTFTFRRPPPRPRPGADLRRGAGRRRSGQFRRLRRGDRPGTGAAPSADLPLAFGSAAGFCLTFLGSKHLAFRPAKVAAEAQSS